MEVLGPGHARDAFRCGVDALDQYLILQASQDVRRRVSACYVAVEINSGKVAGYYTLAAAGVPLTELASELTKRLPRYPSVPVARVGRLAVDLAFHNGNSPNRGTGRGNKLSAVSPKRVAVRRPGNRSNSSGVR